jgi:hypothetical protein
MVEEGKEGSFSISTIPTRPWLWAGTRAWPWLYFHRYTHWRKLKRAKLYKIGNSSCGNYPAHLLLGPAINEVYALFKDGQTRSRMTSWRRVTIRGIEWVQLLTYSYPLFRCELFFSFPSYPYTLIESRGRYGVYGSYGALLAMPVSSLCYPQCFLNVTSKLLPATPDSLYSIKWLFIFF